MTDPSISEEYDPTLARRADIVLREKDPLCSSGSCKIYQDPDFEDRVLKIGMLWELDAQSKGDASSDWNSLSQEECAERVNLYSMTIALNEAHGLRALNRQGIRNVPLFFGHCWIGRGGEAQSCISMEYARGMNLKNAINQARLDTKIEGVLPMRDRARAIFDTVDFLDDMYRFSAVHGDMKDVNTIYQKGSVEGEGTTRVIDFELSQTPVQLDIDGIDLEEVRQPKSEWEVYTPLGEPPRIDTFGQKMYKGRIGFTRRWISPEQARNEELNSRTDWFSTGLLAYAMMVNRSTFDLDRIILGEDPRADTATLEPNSLDVRQRYSRTHMIQFMNLMRDQGLSPRLVEAIGYTLDPTPQNRILGPLKSITQRIAEGSETIN